MEINVAQPKVFLASYLPDRRLDAKPIVASHNTLCPHLFKKVPNDRERKLHSTPTQEKAIFIGAELCLLSAVTTIDIPGGEEVDDY